MPRDLNQLQNRIGYRFRDVKWLYIALTHSSCQNEWLETNQRLEFLGDRVLSAIIAEELFNRHPFISEGWLAKIQSQITRNSSLVTHAKALNLGENLRTHTDNPELRTLDSSLADAFEALVCAIKLDGGWDAARGFVLREFASDLNETAAHKGIENPKGNLQTYLQQFSRPAPTYKDIPSSGPSYDPIFICAAMCGDDELGRGTGRTKKEAQANAARKALEELKAKQPP